jgi:hypothetical protein
MSAKVQVTHPIEYSSGTGSTPGSLSWMAHEQAGYAPSRTLQDRSRVSAFRGVPQTVSQGSAEAVRT